MRVHVCDDLAVALELLHGLDLGPHIGECIFVCTGYPLQDSRLGGSVVGFGYADEVDMRETALGEVLVDGDTVVAHLDLGARRKGAWRGIGDGDGRWSAVCGLLGHGMGGRGRIASGGHLGGEGACCGAGQRRSYILRIELARGSAGLLLGREKGEGVVRLSKGGMPGDACDRTVVNGPLQLRAHGRSHPRQRHNVSLDHHASPSLTPHADLLVCHSPPLTQLFQSRTLEQSHSPGL